MAKNKLTRYLQFSDLGSCAIDSLLVDACLMHPSLCDSSYRDNSNSHRKRCTCSYSTYAHHCGKFHSFGICSVNWFASLILIKPELSVSMEAAIWCPLRASFFVVWGSRTLQKAEIPSCFYESDSITRILVWWNPWSLIVGLTWIDCTFGLQRE